jgi:hypothetical protein
MRNLEMQLLLWCTLINWLSYIFCMACIMYRKDVFPWDRYCDSSCISSMKCKTSCIVRKTVCIVRKGEKQIQILDGH